MICRLSMVRGRRRRDEAIFAKKNRGRQRRPRLAAAQLLQPYFSSFELLFKDDACVSNEFSGASPNRGSIVFRID